MNSFAGSDKQKLSRNYRENSTLERGKNEQAALTLAANASDLSSPLEFGDGLRERCIGRVHPVKRRQLAQIKTRLLVKFAQYRCA